jgi:flagellar M-ring protein FliF
MAEIDFDDDDDDLEDDHDVDDDLFDDDDVDENATDDDIEDIDIEPATSANTGNFFSKRRIIIIAVIIGSVFVISTFMFGLRTSQPKSKNNNNYTTQLVTSQKSEKKQNTKKKKIKYTKLYDVLTTQLPDILRELSLAGIEFNIEQKGKNATIFVDEKYLNTAKNLLAIKGLPSQSARGYQLLDNAQTLGVTEFDKRVRFLRALSGEIEKAIMQFDIIDNCKVQIVLPEQRLFAVTQPPVTSSILIRKVPGTKINDDIVFSIIELVSNAVENLQPENISVIDTSGKVLSEGIFERLASNKRKKRQVQIVKNQKDKKAPKSKALPKIGQPIIPDFNSIKQWYEVKRKFEKTLEEKTRRQITGLLPRDSFKIAINADIGPLEDGKIVHIRRLSTSIVVDNARDDIDLDSSTKTQLFNTVAASTGYVKDRDSIMLGKANFSMLSDDEKKELTAKETHRKQIKIIFKYGPFILIIIILIATINFLRKYRKNKKELKPPTDIISPDMTRDTDFTDLQDEIDNEKKIEQIKEAAQQDPGIVARIMEEWLEDSEKTEDEI